MSNPSSSLPISAPPKQFVWRKRIATAVFSVVLLSALFSYYGYWLNTDAVQLAQPVDACVLMGGYHRHELAADWLRQGHCRSIVIFSSPPTTLVKLGIQKPGNEVSRQQLHQLGVPVDRIQEFSSTAREHDLPQAPVSYTHLTLPTKA